MKRLAWLLVALGSALLSTLAGCVAPPSIPPMPRPLPTSRYIVYFPWFPLPDSRYGRGLAATYSGIAGCQDAAQVGAKWLYDWGPFPPLCPGVLSLPMIWERQPGVCPDVGPGNPILLWNEPSNPDQWGGNPLSTSEAIALTYHLIEICYPNRTFATPAEYNPGGLRWMTMWWDGYVTKYGKPPRVSLMATHCYSSNAGACIGALTDNIAWAKARGLRMLVTEWGVVPAWAGSEIIALREADTLLHWMANQPEIVGEAFFAARITGDEWWSFKPPVTSLLDTETGELTIWGRWYAAQ